MKKRATKHSPDISDELKALQQEHEELKKLLLQKELEIMVARAYLEVEARNQGYKNVEELKKKLRDQT
ncbi:MAG: hypothetical protein HPY71_11870 [Firmicutes bacterium]|nr:hypothetical protein [Bacillota bacterium]